VWPTEAECEIGFKGLMRAAGMSEAIKGWKPNCLRMPRTYILCLASTSSLADVEECSDARTLKEASIFANRAKFLRPATWNVVGSQETEERASVAFMVPFAATDGTPNSANVMVAVVKAKRGIDIVSFSVEILTSGAELTVIADSHPSVNSRKTKSSGLQGDTTYTIVDYFELDGSHTIGVHVRLAYPKVPGVESWNGVQEFETLLRSLVLEEI
jgi:hypothetical protein